MIKYIKQKEYKNILIYISTFIASGLTGIIIFPYSIAHIFFSYRGKEVTGNLFEFSTIVSNIKENLNLINTEIFNGYGHIVIIFTFIICVLWILTKKKQIR